MIGAPLEHDDEGALNQCACVSKLKAASTCKLVSARKFHHRHGHFSRCCAKPAGRRRPTDFAAGNAAAALAHIAGMAAEGDVPDDDEQECCCAHQLGHHRLKPFARLSGVMLGELLCCHLSSLHVVQQLPGSAARTCITIAATCSCSLSASQQDNLFGVNFAASEPHSSKTWMAACQPEVGRSLHMAHIAGR